jgi:predicted transcriptional regulator
MFGSSGTTLSRRERQIMEVVYRLGRATVTDVMAQLTGQPSYSTVRAQLRVLEGKGHLRHEEENLRYVYLPAVPHGQMRQSALEYVVDTFFDGSPEQVVAALFGTERRLSKAQLDRIARLIDQARKGGKRR